MININIGIIGTGAVAHEHLQRYREIDNCSVVGVFDIDNAKSSHFAKTYNIPYIFQSISDLLQCAEISGVSVAVPEKLHYDVAMKVVRSGKAILCEKPLTIESAESAKLVEEVRNSNQINMVNFSYRRIPALKVAHDLVKEGKLGKIKHIDATYLNGWLTHTVDGDWKTLPHQLRRLSTKHGSFGVLYDLGSHLIDFVTYVAGDIVKVYCETKTLPKGNVEKIDNYAFDSNDTAIVIAEFECGALGSLNISRWGTGHKRRIRLNVFGDNGALEIETEKSEDQINLCLDKDVTDAKFKSVKCSTVPNIYQLFVKGISDNVQPKPSFIEGHNVTKVLESCYLSSKKNEMVEINY